MKDLNSFIIKPIVSEKSFAEAKVGKYTFKVARYATKVDVQHAVERIFGVKVVRVFTTNVKSSKTRNTRYARRRIDDSYKKARVELVKGQKIDIFEEKADEKKEKKETKSKK
jgi:large subunit ribosomal protein L23